MRQDDDGDLRQRKAEAVQGAQSQTAETNLGSPEWRGNR
jgi:hypothetical protein